MVQLWPTARFLGIFVLFLYLHERGEVPTPQMQLFPFTFLDLRHTKQDVLHIPPLLFVILDQFRDDCMSKHIS